MNPQKVVQWSRMKVADCVILMLGGLAKIFAFDCSIFIQCFNWVLQITCSCRWHDLVKGGGKWQNRILNYLITCKALACLLSLQIYVEEKSKRGNQTHLGRLTVSPLRVAGNILFLNMREQRIIFCQRLILLLVSLALLCHTFFRSTQRENFSKIFVIFCHLRLFQSLL